MGRLKSLTILDRNPSGFSVWPPSWPDANPLKLSMNNQCIAVLGVAIAVALQAEVVSDAVFPVVTSQRLLAADHNRILQD
jgi:hypothetical protein